MADIIRLESEGDPQGRRNEQVASGECPLCPIKACESGGNHAPLRIRDRSRVVYVKVKLGIEVGWEMGLQARQFVLSESNEAIEAGLVFGKAFHGFVKVLRYYYGKDTKYCWVEHLQGDKKRRNRHIIVIGDSKLDLAFLSRYWEGVYRSYLPVRRGVRYLITSSSSSARYICRYVSGEGFQRAYFSRNWVFEDWWKYSKFLRKRGGAYPTVSELTELAKLDIYSRLKVAAFCEFFRSGQAARLRRVDLRIWGEG
ncbi:hypothetical protein ACFLXV_03935 [Chloroflexota bacterium]